MDLNIRRAKNIIYIYKENIKIILFRRNENIKKNL